jgi:outer membrane protein assembly factor BamB
MKSLRSKTTAIAIALFLVLTIAVTIVALPAANAHTPPWTVVTHAYIAVSPNPVGVEQSAFVVFWLDWVPPGAGGTGGDRWRNLKVEVTKPNGDKETLGPYTSDPIGGGSVLYTPDQVGTYTFVFTFPGQTPSLYGPTGEISVNPSLWDYINDTFQASSATTTLTVQQDPVAEPPNYPLPTEYWTRPIEGENTAWASIASNYLYPFGAAYSAGSMRFQPDGVAPNSPHIMWTKPLQFGGVVGGSNTAIPGVTFYTGLSYESRFSSPLIIYGRLYYRVPFSDNPQLGGYVCVDLRTGEQLWWQNYTVYPSFGQLYDYESINQHGVIPNGYLWATQTAAGVTTWMAFDAMTGNWLFNLTNVPSGTMVYAPDGSINLYRLDATNKWLAKWDSSAIPTGPLVLTPGTSTNAYQYRPIGKNANMSNAYAWNATGLTAVPAGSTIIKVIPDDMILLSTSPAGMVFRWGTVEFTVTALSLKPNSRGALLWQKNYTAPSGITRQWGPVDPESRVFTLNDKETMQWLGYDLDSGNLLWGPLGNPRAFNYYPTIGMGSSGPAGFVAYQKLYTGGYGGEFFCYEMRTGKLLWKYNNTFSAHETPWGNYPIFPAAICDGKVYVYSGEHSPNVPPYKGSRARCLNATTGEEIWTMLSWGAVGGFADEGWPVADGSLVYYNCYDMQVYCLGKGPSATTVAASPKVSVHGNNVLIEGTVIDTAAGTAQKEQAARFPNGVPAVSDASMGQWMEYVYMQKPIPTNATGVTVSLDTLDPNGNFVHIGTPTTDTSGLYSYAFTPEVPGKYTIIATFAGSESYWGSYAETAIDVQEAPPESPPPEYPQPIDYTLPIVGTGVAMILAIVLVGIWIKKK